MVPVGLLGHPLVERNDDDDDGSCDQKTLSLVDTNASHWRPQAAVEQENRNLIHIHLVQLHCEAEQTVDVVVIVA